MPAPQTHNGLTGLIAEHATGTFDGEERKFDGMWSSSLTASASKGKPDIETVTTSERIGVRAVLGGPSVPAWRRASLASYSPLTRRAAPCPHSS